MKIAIQAPIGATLDRVKIFVRAAKLSRIRIGEIEIRVVHRECAGSDERGQASHNLVASTDRGSIKPEVARLDQSGREERVIHATDRNRQIPFRQTTCFPLEESAIEPNRIFLEVAALGVVSVP
jgi:hypothetical protein